MPKMTYGDVQKKVYCGLNNEFHGSGQIEALTSKNDRLMLLVSELLALMYTNGHMTIEEVQKLTYSWIDWSEE